MKFEEFSFVGTEPLGSTTRISCAGGVLRFEGKLTLSLGTAISTAWEVPCLALTGFFVSVKEMQRAKKQRYRALSITLSLWDGQTFSTSPSDFGDDGAAEQALINLNHQVTLANLKWPLSKMRALAARRTTTPGRIRDGNVLGPQGREEFMNCLDYVAPEIAQAWSHSSSAHDWPLGVETGLENGQPVTVALLPEAIVWVRLGESASVDRVRFDEVTSVDVQIRVEGTGHAVGLIVESRSHASNTFWQTYENRELVQRLYRFVVNQWARYRPFDDEALVDEIEALEAQLSAGQLDATVYFTLVAGMARRAVGEVVPASYPWREEVYIRPPEVARAAPARGPGMSGAQARRTGMALGALAAAAMSMGDE